MYKLFIFFLLLPTFVGATEYLVQVPVDIRDVKGEDWLYQIAVLVVDVDYLIARVDESQLGILPSCTILDTEPQTKNYIKVIAPTEEGKARVRELGDVLVESDDFLLIRIAGERPKIDMQGILSIVSLRMEGMVIRWESEAPPEVKYDDYVADMVDAVDEAEYKGYIQHMQDFGTRYASTLQYRQACDYVLGLYQTWGYDAYLDEFTVPVPPDQYQCWNVVAEKPGIEDPTRIYIICGHLDSVADDIYNAPGANDNASGTCTALLAAGIMQRVNFRYTIRFINFGAEEHDLDGSEHYAQEAYIEGENIAGVVNLDMIMYAPQDYERIWIRYDDQSEWLAEFFENTAANYVPDLGVELSYAPGATGSDHASFWHYGYSAFETIERALQYDPYYHTGFDRLENYQEYFPFPTRVVQAAVACIASLAEPFSGCVDAPLQYFTAQSTQNGISLAWDYISDENPAFNLYRMKKCMDNGSCAKDKNSPPSNSFIKVNSSPIEGQGPYTYLDSNVEEGWYSYRLEIMDDTGESPVGYTSVQHTSSLPFSIAKIYPLPSYENITVVLNGAKTNSVQYEIYDLQGRVVECGEKELSNSSFACNIVGLSSGMFFLRVSCSDGEATHPIVHLAK